MNLKNVFKWLVRGWLPEEPKTRKNLLRERVRLPIVIVISATIVLASFYLLSPSAPAQPTSPASVPPPPPTELPTVESNYYPGVSEGDYVKYGNFVCNISRPAGPEWDWMPNLSDVDWQKVEVIGVSEKEVTLRYTEQFKNGSPTEHSGCVHVIENVEYAGRINGSCQFQNYYFGSIIAANLTEGDGIHSEPHPMPFCNIAKTEIRTYLGVSRWVNIINSTNEPHQVIWVYDVFSGMLLEYEETIPNERISYSITETNIFSSPTPIPTSPALQETTAQNIPTDTLYASPGLFVIVILAITMVIFRKRRLKGGENDQK
jgi:hypothetical protein